MALPLGDAKAESFADSMYPRVDLSTEAVLAVADMQSLDDVAISFLQEILCKMSMLLKYFPNSSTAVLFVPPSISPSSLLSFLLSDY